MPMGIKNGPSMFQRMVSHVLAGTSESDIYIDDCLTGTPNQGDKLETLQAHDKAIRSALDCFRRHKLFVKGSKCHMFKRTIKFCGHILSGGTRRAAPDKMKAVEDWTENSIKTVTQLKGFLGLTQHYSIYMKNYAEWAAPLTDALAGRTKFQTRVEWTPRMREGLQKIKEGMRENVLLGIANPYKPYILRVDASGYAVGAVLSQLDGEGNERPCAFFSRKLSGKPGMGQRGWSVREQETYAIVLALLKFRSWIASSQIEILCWSDHKSLELWFKEDLATVSGPLGRRGRWHEFLSSFNLTVCYIKGEENTVADILSRWTYEACQDNDTNMHGGEADLEFFLSKEKEEHKYCRSIEQVWADDQERPRNSSDKMAIHRWAVGMGLKHPDSCLQTARKVPLTWIDSATPPPVFLGTPGVGNFLAESFSDECLTDEFSEFSGDESIQVSATTRSGRKVGGDGDASPHPDTNPCDLPPPDIPPPPQNDPPPVSSHSDHIPTFSSTVPPDPIPVPATNKPSLASPIGKPKKKGTVGEHEKNPQNILFKSWEDEYQGEQKKLWDRLVDGEHVPNTRLLGGKIRVGSKIVVPQTMLLRVLKYLHSFSHTSKRKFIEIFNRSFLWQGPDVVLKTSIDRVDRTCQECQQLRRQTGKKQDTLNHYPVPENIFSSICIDFSEMPAVKVDGTHFDYMMVIVCRLSGYTMSIPTRKKGLTAEKAASLFLQNCVHIFGLPAEILSDVDHLITSHFFTCLCRLSGIRQHQSIIYRPKGNGRAETAVRLTIESLRKILNEVTHKSVNWVTALPLALWNLNDLPGVYNPYSPHYLVFGRNPISFGDVPPIEEPQDCPDAIGYFDLRRKISLEVQKSVETIHRKISARYNKIFSGKKYAKGEKVWLKVLQSTPKETAKKLDVRWLGPCEILEHIIEGRYKISHPVSGEMEVHMDRLKPYMPTLEGDSYPLHYFCPPGIPAEKDDRWEVDKILGHKGAGENMAWKVLWKAGDTTWEKQGQFIHGCQSDWLAYNKKKGISVSVSRVQIDPTPPWEKTFPVWGREWAVHDETRENFECWDLAFN